MVRLAGAEPVIVPTSERNSWKMRAEDFENAMTPRTKMLIMNSPCNPTGSVYTREELQAIVDVAAEEDIYILSDEIYEKLVYDDVKHVSIASLSKEAYDLTITVNGFSKSYAMTGWRLGYLAAPEAVAKAVDSIQSHSTSNPSSFSQYGALAALKRRSTAARRYARGIRYASQLHVRPHLEDLERHCGQTAGRILRAGEHQPAGADFSKFRRPFAEQSQRRCRSGSCLRRRSHDPVQLRHQHRRDQKRSGPLPGFLPDAVICHPESSDDEGSHSRRFAILASKTVARTMKLRALSFVRSKSF